MGRKIAIFADAHGLLEPVEAVIKDAKLRGITEIYSLGDNIGDGPNPKEVIELLEKENIKSVAGNAEYYITLGTNPFSSYLYGSRLKNIEWTRNELLKGGLVKNLELMPPSIELCIGNKNIALVHFANDVRFDYSNHSTWTYQDTYSNRQFHYTNSDRSKLDLLRKKDSTSSYDKGYVDAYHNPILGGKTVDKFDEIIQGHVHFSMLTKDPSTIFRTVRGVGIAYQDHPKDEAYYIIVEELDDGYKIDEIYVPYDREKMLNSIKNSNIPDNSLISKFTR